MHRILYPVARSPPVPKQLRLLPRNSARGCNERAEEQKVRGVGKAEAVPLEQRKHGEAADGAQPADEQRSVGEERARGRKGE